jgi:membrane protease YdiL (CAAX protease family)
MTASARAVAFEARLARAPLWLLLVYEVVAILGGVTVYQLRVPAPWKDLLIALFTFAAALTWVWRVCPRDGFSFGQVVGAAPARRVWPWIVLVAFNNVALSVGLYGLSRLLDVPIVEATDIGPSQAESGFGGRVLFFVLIALFAAPPVEELVFRGVLFRKWRQRFGPVAALALTSIAFGLLHPGRQLNMALLGVQLVLLYTSTRTLWAPMSAHLVNNSVAVVALIASSGSPTTDVRPDLLETAIALALGGAGLIWIVRKTWRTLRDPLPPFVAADRVDVLPPAEGATAPS